MVEPDVHEEAMHVGPEQRRANQMCQTLEEEKKQAKCKEMQLKFKNPKERWRR